MFKRLKSLWKGVERPDPPEGLIYAIGDIHGRLDLLDTLLDLIAKDADGAPCELVFLGDYIDRGDQSRGVIDRLIEVQSWSLSSCFLMGNHEATLLDFLKGGPVGPSWMQYGGGETLLSYGVRPPLGRGTDEEWEDTRQALASAISPEQLAFYQSLQLSAERGCYLFVHAGVDPNTPLAQQTERSLLWIRDEFLSATRPLERVIVHGHTPEDQPHADDRRIGLDTGAYLTGRLTAVRLEHGQTRFIST